MRKWNSLFTAKVFVKIFKTPLFGGGKVHMGEKKRNETVSPKCKAAAKSLQSCLTLCDP